MLQMFVQSLFVAWERRLAAATTDRVVRPFDWGLDWIPPNGHVATQPADRIAEWVSKIMADTDEFFTPPPTREYALTAPSADGDRTLTFPSALPTPRGEDISSRRRSGPAAVERRRRRTRRLVPAAELERHERAATQPAVSPSAD